VNCAGEVLGEHRGLPFYTVGQRKGLGLSAPRPLYVLALRPEANQVVLGEEHELYGDTLRVTGVNWVSREPPATPIEEDGITVKVRYAHEGTPARLVPDGDGDDPTAVRVEFLEPVRAIAPGQAAVFYAGDVLLGGGWIQPDTLP
jgi:tRNA-specific 2-thiouridylase